MPGLVVINTLPGDHFESVEEKLSENIRALTRTQMQKQTKSTRQSHNTGLLKLKSK